MEYTEEWYKEYQRRQKQYTTEEIKKKNEYAQQSQDHIITNRNTMYTNESTSNFQKETKVDKCNVAKTKSKYRAIKCEIDGHTFDSKAEAKRYSELKLMQQAGKISELQLQPRYILQDSFKKNGQAFRKIEYIADFSYMENGNLIIEDVKRYEDKRI